MSRDSQVRALLRRTDLKPIDFSIFKDFEFIGGVGNYSKKQVCIMSALHLATEISLGNTTLEASIMSAGDWWELSQEQQKGLKRRIEATDKVMCVSDAIRDLAIGRNYNTADMEARRAWASALMPRLLGTYLGEKFDEKLRQLREHFPLRPFLEGYVKKLQDERATLDPRTKRAREITDLVDHATGQLSHDYIDREDFKSPLEVALYDAMLDLLIDAAKTERERRDRVNAARQAKK
jgi:hypothetical protein